MKGAPPCLTSFFPRSPFPLPAFIFQTPAGVDKVGAELMDKALGGESLFVSTQLKGISRAL